MWKLVKKSTEDCSDLKVIIGQQFGRKAGNYMGKQEQTGTHEEKQELRRKAKIHPLGSQ